LENSQDFYPETSTKLYIHEFGFRRTLQPWAETFADTSEGGRFCENHTTHLHGKQSYFVTLYLYSLFVTISH